MGDSGIAEIFMNESKEIIGNLESDIISLEEKSDDEEMVNGIFRYFHTLKGSSGIAGFNTVYEFTHNLENLFDKVRSGELGVKAELVDLLLTSLDWIKAEIFEGGETEESKVLKDDLTFRINSYMGIKTSEDDKISDEVELVPEVMAENIKYFRIVIKFRENIFNFGIDPLMIIEDLTNLGELEVLSVNKSKLPDLFSMDPVKCYLSWDLVLRTESDIQKVHDVFLFVEDDNDITVEDVTEHHSDDSGNRKYVTEKKLGEILVDQGVIKDSDLEQIVELQNKKNQKIGDIVVDKGLASSKQVHDALQEQNRIKKKVEISTIRVDSGKLDSLMNLLGEIVIGQASLHKIADEMDEQNAFGFKNSLYSLDRVTREFQEQIMSIRMVPIGPTFEQFKRFVRDTANNLGKDIKLKIEGGDTELDKTVIEKIGDPLKHMIRNSIDHGIESAEERVQNGKDKTGSLTLKAYHQEGNVYIDIVDDGRGINLKKVKDKAVSKGLIGQDEDPSRDKLLALLFNPGFSTAEQVGDLSGRGVGMDVVRTNIEELRGAIEIKTTEGEGTLVRIKLPLTLAIIEGMLIGIGNSILIIPLLSVIETIQIKKEDYKTVEGRGELILVRGEYISLIRLGDMFGLETEYEDPWESLIVIVESDGKRVGIMIDELIGQQQIVIKSIESHITSSRALSGATILGDGRVALIIDIHGLVEEIN